jgi:hypothetical protein
MQQGVSVSAANQTGHAWCSRCAQVRTSITTVIRTWPCMSTPASSSLQRVGDLPRCVKRSPAADPLLRNRVSRRPKLPTDQTESISATTRSRRFAGPPSSGDWTRCSVLAARFGTRRFRREVIRRCEHPRACPPSLDTRVASGPEKSGSHHPGNQDAGALRRPRRNA